MTLAALLPLYDLGRRGWGLGFSQTINLNVWTPDPLAMFTLTWPKILLAFTSPGAPGSCSTCLTSTPGLFQQNCYPGRESQHAAASCHTTKAHLLVWHKYMCVLAHVRFSHIFSHVQAIHQLWEALPLLFCNEPHTNTFKHLSTLVQNHKSLVREKCTLDKKFRCNKHDPDLFILQFLSFFYQFCFLFHIIL